MKQTGTVKLAKVLRVLVTITFICILIVLPLVPGLVSISSEGGIYALWEAMENSALIRPLIFLAVCWQSLWRVWREQYAAMLTVFLLFCGSCTAIILWQARGVLNTIVRQDTFTKPNARHMKTAAICCFSIGGAALCRTIWGVFFFKSIHPLFTYNALFTPIFVLAGLLCMVMSALFRQAAELKEENDLTI